MTTRRKPHPHLSGHHNRRALAFATVCAGLVSVMIVRAQAQTSPPKQGTPTQKTAPKTANTPSPFVHSAKASKVIYPAPSKQLRFSHKKHANTSCVTCHAQAVASTKSSTSLTPSMSVCASCHGAQATSTASTKTQAPSADKATNETANKKPSNASKPTLNQCSACHMNYAVTAKGDVQTPAQWRAIRPSPMPVVRTVAKIKFNHNAHLKHSTSAAMTQRLCVQCHADAAQSGQPKLPTGAQCATCHTGQLAKSTCTTCHLKAKNGKMQTAFAQTGHTTKKTVAPNVIKLKPDNHTIDWIKRHGAMAKAQGNSCMSCHAQTTCTSCHQQKNAIPRSVHPPNFVIVHSTAAKSAAANCTTCHQQQTFCTSCHIRTKSTPRVGAKPPLARKSFHPPGWLNKANARNHGVLAKQNINNCASCHQENDCLSCHKGISPHPQNFAMGCKRRLKANPQPCLKCHQNTRALTLLCR